MIITSENAAGIKSAAFYLILSEWRRDSYIIWQ